MQRKLAEEARKGIAVARDDKKKAAPPALLFTADGRSRVPFVQWAQQFKVVAEENHSASIEEVARTRQEEDILITEAHESSCSHSPSHDTLVSRIQTKLDR